MGDREREKGKQKRPKYEEVGDSSEVSARRTRARTTQSAGGQSGAGEPSDDSERTTTETPPSQSGSCDNPSLPALDPRLRDDRSRNWPGPQQQPAAQDGSEKNMISETDRRRRVESWMQDTEVTASFAAPLEGMTNFTWDSMRQQRYATESQSTATAGQPGAAMGAFGFGRDGTAQPTAADFSWTPELIANFRAQESGGVGNPDDRGRNWPGPQHLPAAQGRGEDVRLHDQAFISSLMAALEAAHRQETGGVGNPGTFMPPLRTGTPSSTSQMNFATDSRMTEPRHASVMVPQPRPQAPSSSQAQQTYMGPIFPRTNIFDDLLQLQGLSMRAPPPSTGAQRGGTSGDVARGRGLQVQPQPQANTAAVVLCPVCHNKPRHNQCRFCGRKPDPADFAIDPRQCQPPPPPPPSPPPQQGLPAALTSHTTLNPLPSSLDIIRPQRYTFAPCMPRSPGLMIGQAQPSAGAGQNHFLQVPQHLCPGCRSLPGLIAPYPWRHLCLCTGCRLSHVVCPICACGQAATSPG